MPNKVMVAGVNKTAYVHRPSNVTINRNLNERHMASLTFTPGFVPSRLDAIEIYAEDDVTLLFGGLIINRTLHGVFTESWESMVSVECADYSTYLDWYYIDLSYTADTTLDIVLTAIVAALPAGYGITKGGSGYTDTIKPFTWTAMRTSDALRELSNATGRGLKVSATKVLSMPTLPDGSAPKNYADGGVTPRETSWADPFEVPANTVILSCGPTGSAYHTYAWTANGSASSWVMDIPASGPGVSRTLLLVISGNNVYATVDEGTGGWFTWDWATRTISVNNYPLTLPIPNGTAMSFEYLAQYPFSVMRPASLPTTPIVALFKDEAITEYARGVDAADGLLDKISGQPRSVDVRDGTHGWQPGQSLFISMSGSRSLSASAMVKSVELTLYEAGGWEYINTIVENTVYDGSYLDKWRSMSGSSSGVAVLGGGSGGGGTTVISAGAAHLGGSRSEMLTTNAWTEIIHYQVLLCVATGTYNFRSEVRTTNAGTTVTARLYDLTAGAVVASGTVPASTATSWTETILSVALVAGHRYRVEVQGGNTSAPVLVGQATIEAQA